jgi:hypothetical protein
MIAVNLTLDSSNGFQTSRLTIPNGIHIFEEHGGMRPIIPST